MLGEGARTEDDAKRYLASYQHAIDTLAQRERVFAELLPRAWRLLKGAYWDAENKRAQELGLAGYPVCTRKQHTDLSYLACARAMLNHAMRSTRSSPPTTRARSRPLPRWRSRQARATSCNACTAWARVSIAK